MSKYGKIFEPLEKLLVEAGEEGAEKAAREAAEKTAKEAAEKAGKEAAEEAAEKTAKEAAEEGAEDAQEKALRELMDEVESADVRSPRDGANFYSGRAPDGTSMREFAEANTDGVTKVTLEQTPGGKYFDDMKLYEEGSPIRPDQADKVWGRLSERYAENASGEATAWAHNPREGSIWNTVEKKALEENPNVTGIHVIDPVA